MVFSLILQTQFIQFFHHSHLKTDPHIFFCGHRLPVVTQVIHLGHILTYNLSDIQSKCRDMVCKANSLFCSFPNISPEILTFLFRSFCLGLYGSSLRSHSSGALSSLLIKCYVYGNFPIIPTQELFNAVLSYKACLT